MIEYRSSDPRPKLGHAQHLRPLINELIVALDFSGLDGVAESRRGGANSWVLTIKFSDRVSHEYHFRGMSVDSHLDAIAVYPVYQYNYWNVAPTAIIQTPHQARAFVRRLQEHGMALKAARVRAMRDFGHKRRKLRIQKVAA